MELDNIFNEFEKSKLDKEVESAKKSELNDKLLEDARGKITKFFLPTLEEVCRKVKERGYFINISNNLSSHAPNVTLEFIPQLESTIVNSYTPSSVKVTYIKDDKFCINRDVKSLTGSLVRHKKGSGKLTPTTEIATPEWIENIMHEFISSVLDTNK